MASTVYKVGDRLFEGAHHEIRGKRRPIVRTWEILSVAPDPKWQDNDGQPLQVVTMRTNAKGAPKYRAESADFVDIDIVAGVWRRTKEDAEAMISTWVGYKPSGAIKKAVAAGRAAEERLRRSGLVLTMKGERRGGAASAARDGTAAFSTGRSAAPFGGPLT